MALPINIFARTSGTTIDTLTLDASLKESHSGDVEVTDHPVETGFAVTDHARAKPDVITIEGLVSNTPLNRKQQRRIVKSQGKSFYTSTSEDQIAGQPGYAEKAYALLRQIRETGKIVRIVTSLRTYDNMLMTSLVVPRDKSIGDALQFTAQFKQIRIVENKLTQTTVTKEPKAKPKVATGKQAPKATNKAEDESWAYTLADKLGILDKLGIKK